MTNNLLGQVRNQFRTRGYTVDEIRTDTLGHSQFTIESDRDRNPFAVTVTFIPTDANPDGEHWVPADIHWATDKTTYTGTTELAAADLADTIIDTAAQDNFRPQA